MAQITVSLPSSLNNNEQNLMVDASNVQELFSHIRKANRRAFETLFREHADLLLPKAFVAMFVNDEQTFDNRLALKEGDKVSFGVAIAGG